MGRTSESAEPAAERREVLARLPHAWSVLHETPWPGRPGRTLEHIAIGPSGIFVVVEGLDPAEAVAAAEVIARLLPGLPREHVLGVLVGADHPAPWAEVDGAILCDGTDLARLLRSLPRTLTSEQVAGIVGVVHVALERVDRARSTAAAADAAAGDPVPPAPARGHSQSLAQGRIADVQAVAEIRRGLRRQRAGGAHRTINGTS